eukprot:2731871-Amphidinium_carterae.1
MLQHLSYVATQYLLNDEEMMDQTEYHLIYHEIGTPLLQKRENTSTNSPKHSTTTAESYSMS